ncbi:MAG: EfeM/EfeO family lipoprotein [Deltaproteobacteria bacterium]|nr:EfeM/EfeO family lipoprotein [Deltaproteobacteria bacterium]
MPRYLATALLLFGAMGSMSCEQSLDPQSRALTGVEAYLDAELEVLRAAVGDLAAAAPAPDDDGWNAREDAGEVTEMKAAWRRVRASYERIEGAVGHLFPSIAHGVDGRYEGFIDDAADTNLFDGDGVTGMHAIERVLWADAHSPSVVAFESALPRYAPAAFPSDEAGARAFRDELVGRLAGDMASMQESFEPLVLDPATAFHGVTESVEAQVETLDLPGPGAEESRYARTTLDDMRANLEGGLEIYQEFRPWLVQQGDGPAVDAAVVAGFGRISAAYDALPGAALPEVPEAWNSASPTAADLGTPYGELVALLVRESDPDDDGSLISAMNRAADALRIPRAR